MVASNIQTFRGHNAFRQRLILSTLSGKPIRIENIRSDHEESPGLAGTFFDKERLIYKTMKSHS